jgi:hypothetical protein
VALRMRLRAEGVELPSPCMPQTVRSHATPTAKATPAHSLTTRGQESLLRVRLRVSERGVLVDSAREGRGARGVCGAGGCGAPLSTRKTESAT